MRREHRSGGGQRAAIAAWLICALVGVTTSTVGCGAHAGRPLAVGPVAKLPQSRSSRLAVIVMENAEYDEVIGNQQAPYVNALAHRYGLASRSFAVAHPSLPNYLALTSGSTHGISSDCTSCSVAATSIVDQLEAAGVSWRAYLEDIPAPCFGGATAGGYAKKHNPFIYYRSVARRPSSCRRLVGFRELSSDLRADTLPTYVWISPNLCDDGHDCGLATADRFLARTVPALLRELGPHGLLLITWDEGNSDSGCCKVAHGGHIATILAGPDVIPGARQAQPIDHYGVLATIEQELGLEPLAAAADPSGGRLTALLRRGAPAVHAAALRPRPRR